MKSKISIRKTWKLVTYYAHLSSHSAERERFLRESHPCCEQLLEVGRTQTRQRVPPRRRTETEIPIRPTRVVVPLGDVVEHVRERVRVQLRDHIQGRVR